MEKTPTRKASRAFRVRVVGSNPADPTTRGTSPASAKIFKTLWALKDEYFCFVWLLRPEAFLRFGYDPYAVFSEKADDQGFGK